MSPIENGSDQVIFKEGCDSSELQDESKFGTILPKVESENDAECEKIDEGDCDTTVPLPEEDEDEYQECSHDDYTSDDTTEPPESAQPCDPSWNNEEHVEVKCPSTQSSLNVSLWSVDSTSDKTTDFLNGKFELLGHRGGIPCRFGKKTGFSMTNPQDRVGNGKFRTFRNN